MRRILLIVLATLGIFGQGVTPSANHDLGYDDTPMLPGLPFHVHDPLRPHKDLLPVYTDKDIHDVTAYLATLK